MAEKQKCEDPKCDRVISAHAWGRIRAGSDGWFETKDGRLYCPDHQEWVADWRAKQKK